MGSLILLALFRGCAFRPSTHYPGGYFNQGKNAVWVGVEWVSEPHSREEIVALANYLDEHQIRYIFVFVSYPQADGNFASSFAHASRFTQTLKETQSELTVLAWIGLPLQQPQGPIWGYVDLSSEVVRHKVVALSTYLVRLAGFDGVHLDPEPVPSGDANLLALLEEINPAIGPKATLSVAARRIWPVFSDLPWPLVDRIAWRPSYYRKIAERVDQIAVMTYDSGLPTPWLYRQFVCFEVIELSRALDGTGVELLIGIPTSEERTRTHQPWSENIVSGLRGVLDGLNDAQTRPEVISGIALYPYWEMDEQEWKAYASLWLANESE
jgi:hypothetical protein